MCVCVRGGSCQRQKPEYNNTYNGCLSWTTENGRDGRMMAWCKKTNILYQSTQCLYCIHIDGRRRVRVNCNIYETPKHTRHVCSGTKDSKIGRWVTISLTTDRPTDSLASRSIRLWSVVSRYNNVMIEREGGRRSIALSRESRYEHLIDDITRLF